MLIFLESLEQLYLVNDFVLMKFGIYIYIYISVVSFVYYESPRLVLSIDAAFCLSYDTADKRIIYDLYP